MAEQKPISEEINDLIREKLREDLSQEEIARLDQKLTVLRKHAQG